MIFGRAVVVMRHVKVVVVENPFSLRAAIKIINTTTILIEMPLKRTRGPAKAKKTKYR